MRRRYLIAGTLSIIGPLACSGILGDFELVPAPTDGGAIDSATDSPIEAEASLPPTDGGTTLDAVAPLTCTEGKVSDRFQVVSSADGGRVFSEVPLATSFDHDSNTMRVATGAYGNALSYLEAYSFSTTDPQAVVTNYEQLIEGAVLGVQRYAAGFVGLTYENDGAGNYVTAWFLEDSDSAWKGPLMLSSNSPIPIGGGTQLSGAQIAVLDRDAGNYFVAGLDSEDGVSYLRGGSIKNGTPTPFQTISTISGVNQFFSFPSMTVDSTNAYVMTAPETIDPTQILRWSINQATFAGGMDAAGVPIVPSNANAFLLGAVSSPTPGLIDVAFLETDLNTFKAQYRVGQVPLSQFLSFSIDDLTQTPVALGSNGFFDPTAVVIDHNNLNVEVFAPAGNEPMTENLTSIATRSDISGATSGFNFMWWNAPNGALIAEAVAGQALASDVTNIASLGVRFTSAPFSALGQFGVVYVTQPDDDQTPGSLWYTTMSCIR